MDSSGSISEESLNRIKRYVSEVAKDFSISPDNVRVGVINFGDQVYTVLPLTLGTSRDSLMTALQRVKPIQGKPDLEGAYRVAKNNFATSKRVKNVGKVLITILTNDVISKNEVEKLSSDLRKSGVSMGLVALDTPTVPDEILENIAGQPDYFIRLRNSNQLPQGIHFAYTIVSEANGKTFMFTLFSIKG